MMRRLSLSTTVGVLPTIVAVALAAYTYHAESRRREAVAMFNSALAEGQLQPVSRLVSELGAAAARKHLRRAAESDLVAFDGDNRIAQVEKDGLQYPTGRLDRIFLYTIGSRTRVAIQQPPVGTVVDRVKFTRGGLDVTLHGKLTDPNGKRPAILIPGDAPRTCHLPWSAWASPSSPTLSSLIRSRTP
jgi:hypothetical protein